MEPCSPITREYESLFTRAVRVPPLTASSTGTLVSLSTLSIVQDIYLHVGNNWKILPSPSHTAFPDLKHHIRFEGTQPKFVCINFVSLKKKKFVVLEREVHHTKSGYWRKVLLRKDFLEVPCEVEVYLYVQSSHFVLILAMASFFLKFYYLLNFMCTDILTAYMNAYHVHAVSIKARRGHQILLGLELQVVMSYQVGAENRTQILWKSSKCS